MPKVLGDVGFLPRQAIRHVRQGLLEWGQSPRLTQKQFQADHGWDTNAAPLSFSCSCYCPVAGPYAVLTKDTMPQTYKRKRSWSRAVFSNLQRKGLEKRFEIQKYVTKPDRKQLAAMLGLTDAQVKRDIRLVAG